MADVAVAGLAPLLDLEPGASVLVAGREAGAVTAALEASGLRPSGRDGDLLADAAGAFAAAVVAGPPAWVDPVVALSELHRVLAAGARLAFVDAGMLPPEVGRSALFTAPEPASAPGVLIVRQTSPAPGSGGLVASVNTSPGGVPKRPVDRAWVGRLGVDGDGHVYKGHGGVDAAVCLLAQEAIERVRADGHELFPGAVGENVTLLGIDWAALRPGDRLAFDSGLELELTEHATPCQTIAHWFAGRRIARLGQKQHPEDARWYARVLTEGMLEPGDRVHVERSA